jgi:hypothetical protein
MLTPSHRQESLQTLASDGVTLTFSLERETALASIRMPISGPRFNEKGNLWQSPFFFPAHVALYLEERLPNVVSKEGIVPAWVTGLSHKLLLFGALVARMEIAFVAAIRRSSSATLPEPLVTWLRFTEVQVFRFIATDVAAAIGPDKAAALRQHFETIVSEDELFGEP